MRLTKIRNWAKVIKSNLIILDIALKDCRTPWYAKAMIFLVIAYALSPIDLIPDFIPIIGLLDDLILLPMGIYISIQLIPQNILSDAKRNSNNYEWRKRKNWFGLILVISIWLILLILIYRYLLKINIK